MVSKIFFCRGDIVVKSLYLAQQIESTLILLHLCVGERNESQVPVHSYLLCSVQKNMNGKQLYFWNDKPAEKFRALKAAFIIKKCI